jgi:hypothetical protein
MSPVLLVVAGPNGSGKTTAEAPDGRLDAVGSYGVLRAFEGGVWKTQEGSAPGLSPAAACTSDNVAWLFGDGGAIVRKDRP